MKENVADGRDMTPALTEILNGMGFKLDGNAIAPDMPRFTVSDVSPEQLSYLAPSFSSGNMLAAAADVASGLKDVRISTPPIGPTGKGEPYFIDAYHEAALGFFSAPSFGRNVAPVALAA